jgi:signal transduction histidine kinase
LYDDRGRQLAAYPSDALAAETPLGQEALRAATKGRTSTSGVVRHPAGQIIESFIPFPAEGRLRVLVIALPIDRFGRFAVSALRDAAGAPTGGAFLLDRARMIVTAVGKGAQPPDIKQAVATATRDGRGVGRFDSVRFVITPVSGSGLVVALVAPEEELTADLPPAVWPRLALGGFALALLATFLLTSRTFRDSRRVRAARQAADSANETKTRFLSHVSHELRQPLTAIIGFAETLQRRSEDEERRVWATHILQGGQHLLALANELVDIARIESGKVALEIEPVDVRAFVGEVLGFATPLAEERGVRLIEDPPEAPEPPALADSRRLTQVLLNLVSNGIKYNRAKGSVRVSIREAGEGMLRVAVTDDGEGISPEVMGKLFSPFERLGAERGPVGGSGLGLVIAKGLIEAMNGSLDVDSELGTGTTFAFELPIAVRSERRPLAGVDVERSP